MGLDMNKARRLAVCRTLKDYYKKMAERLGGEIKKLNEELYDELESEGLSEIRVSATQPDSRTGEPRLVFPDGRDRILEPDIILHPTVKDQAKFFAWLRANTLGGLIKEQVHAQTLASMVKTRKQENKPLPEQEILTVFDEKAIKVRASKK